MEIDLVVVSAPKGIVYHANTKSAIWASPELATHHKKQRKLESGVNFLLSSTVKLQAKLSPH